MKLQCSLHPHGDSDNRILADRGPSARWVQMTDYIAEFEAVYYFPSGSDGDAEIRQLVAQLQSMLPESAVKIGE